MTIINFSSYFELLAALNVGYAGSEVFRHAFNSEILSLGTNETKILSTIESIESLIVINESNGNRKRANHNTKDYFQNKLSEISAKEKILDTLKKVSNQCSLLLHCFALR